jgi:TRAP transporter TAXI family solute receptor
VTKSRFIIQSGIALLMLLVAASLCQAAEDMGIITGSDKGTYYQFGLDLQKLTKPAGVNLTVHTSKGSIENVYAVYQRPGVQMGIVQSDVLAFVARVQSDPVLSRIAKKTRMVFPLYNEEVHLLGRHGIRDFDDLTGKRVAIGRDGSGTYLTARLLFKLSEVVPAEMVPIDTTEALNELKAGRIDAMFFVAGYPVKLLKEDVSEKDGLELIPIANKSITEFYPRAEIPAGVYDWQRTPVNTVAVKAVLVSFDFRRRDCDNVGRFAQTVSRQMTWLHQNGHPKWKAVDLNYPLKGWEQYDCVGKYIGSGVAGVPATAAKPAASDNPVFNAIKGLLDD